MFKLRHFRKKRIAVTPYSCTTNIYVKNPVRFCARMTITKRQQVILVASLLCYIKVNLNLNR